MLAYWWSIFIEDEYYHAVPSRQARGHSGTQLLSNRALVLKTLEVHEGTRGRLLYGILLDDKLY